MGSLSTPTPTTSPPQQQCTTTSNNLLFDTHNNTSNMLLWPPPATATLQAQQQQQQLSSNISDSSSCSSSGGVVQLDGTSTTPGGGELSECCDELPDVLTLLRAWQLEESTTNNIIPSSTTTSLNNIHNNKTSAPLLSQCYESTILGRTTPPSPPPPLNSHSHLLTTLVEKETTQLARLLHDMYVHERKQQDLALSLIESLGSVKRSLEEELMNSGLGCNNIDLPNIQQLLATARKFGRTITDSNIEPTTILQQQQLSALLNALQARRRLLENLLVSSVVNPLSTIGSCVSLDHLKLINSYTCGKLGLSSPSSTLLNSTNNHHNLHPLHPTTPNNHHHHNHVGIIGGLKGGGGSYRVTRFYFEMEMSGLSIGRIIIETRPDVAPRMCENFKALVTGERGFGFVGCTVFQCWRGESVITGDFEHNNGRGGHSIFESGLFMPEDTRLPSTRGAIGMRRTQKRHDSKGLVGSQFRVILQDMPGFTGIFGRVVEGIELIDKISEIGDPSGNPTKRVVIRKCGAV